MDNLNQINKLQQIIIEDRYSRRNIRKLVEEDITNTLDKKFLKLKKQAEQNVSEYLRYNEHYDSKMRRKTELLFTDKFSISDIVTEILISVMSMNSPQPIQSAVNHLASTLELEENYDCIITAAELIAVVSYVGIFDIIPAKNSSTGSMMINPNYALEEATLQRIANTKYLPPMIVKPKRVVFNKGSGYLTCSTDSIILGRDNHHNNTQAKDVLNIMNSIQLTLDETILAMQEEPSKPLDTQEKIDNFNRMRISSRGVYNEMVEYGNKFYVTHKFDKRGRLYSQGYHVHIQSTEYKKALINLTKKETIKLT